jgi:hypothetical protein
MNTGKIVFVYNSIKTLVYTLFKNIRKSLDITNIIKPEGWMEHTEIWEKEVYSQHWCGLRECREITF